MISRFLFSKRVLGVCLCLSLTLAMFYAYLLTSKPSTVTCDEHTVKELKGAGIDVLYARLMALHEKLVSVAGGMENVIGNIAWFPEQTMYYYRQAAREEVRTICEVGFGAGHSTVIYLTANPHVKVYTFDYFVFESDTDEKYAVQRTAAKFIDGFFTGRWTRVPGGSEESVPDFIAKHPDVKCDLISVDGGHFYSNLRLDTQNVLNFGAEKASILYDDLQDIELQRAIDDEVSEGRISVTECMRASRSTDERFSYMKHDKVYCSFRRGSGVKTKAVSVVERALIGGSNNPD